MMFPFVFTYTWVCVRSKKRRPAGKNGDMSIAADDPSSFGERHCPSGP
ncbi:MAG: hypothetical protein M5U28_44740 [Sandaracinaceae bacterium]|nr:hypothetical protein [Sandaracinaceae bacterium]